MTPRRKTVLASNIVWLYGLQGLNYLTPAVLLSYLVRTLGVEHYGLIAFAQALAQYFILATDYGFNFSATRSIAIYRDDREKVSRVFWTVITLKVLLLTVCAVIMEAVILTVPRFHENGPVYQAAFLMVLGNAIFPLWLFQGLENMRSVSIITAGGRVLAAVAVVTFVKGPQDTVLATLLLSAGFVFSGIVGLITALRSYVNSFQMPQTKDLWDAVAEGRHLFLTTAAVSLYSNTNTFLVGLLAGETQAGYFSLADKLVRAIGGMTTPVIQATYPHVIAFIEHSRQEALQFLRKVSLYAIAAGSVLSIAMFLAARWLGHLAFAGQADVTVLYLLRILAFFPLLSTVTYVFGVLILIPFGLEKPQSRMLLTIGAANVVLGMVLIPRYGALGGTVAMVVIEAVQAVGSLFLLHRSGIHVFKAALSWPAVERAR